MSEISHREFWDFNRGPEIEQQLSDVYSAIDELRSHPDLLSLNEISAIVQDLALLDQLQESTNRLQRTKAQAPSIQILDRVVRRVDALVKDSTQFQAFFKTQSKKIERYSLPKNEFARYDTFHGKMIVEATKDVIPSPSNALLSLAASGSEFGFVVMHREFIRTLQEPLPQEVRKKLFSEVIVFTATSLGVTAALPEKYRESFLSLVGLYGLFAITQFFEDPKKSLKTIHSNIGSSLYSNRHPSRVADELYSRLVGNDFFKKISGKETQFYSAYDDIRRLYALGCSDTEIAKLVQHSKWDGEVKVYDHIDREITIRMRTHGYTEADVDNLVALRDLKRQLYLLMVRRIAQEELVRAQEQLLSQSQT